VGSIADAGTPRVLHGARSARLIAIEQMSRGYGFLAIMERCGRGVPARME
jgi:hypothetical protein